MLRVKSDKSVWLRVILVPGGRAPLGRLQELRPLEMSPEICDSPISSPETSLPLSSGTDLVYRLFINFRWNCARSVNGQWNSELKRIFPEVFVFPFRFTRVTEALGTRLVLHRLLVTLRMLRVKSDKSKTNLIGWEDKTNYLRMFQKSDLWRHLGPVSREPQKRFGPGKPFLTSLYLATERCIHLNPCSYKTMRIKQFWNHKVWDFPMAFRVWKPFRDARETGPWPEVAILGAELNERGLWGRENNDARLILHRKLNGTTTW